MSILSTKFLPPFLGVATLAWIAGGTYWYKQQFCDASTSETVTVAVKSAGTHLPFYFPLGESKPVFMGESFALFKKTADFLNSNPNKTLIVKGLVSPKETAKTRATNLGIERAEAIKSALLNVGALSSSIETKSAQKNDLFFVNQQLFDGVEFNMEENAEGYFQALNLFFQKDKYKFADNADLKNYFHALSNYLNLHPTAKLKITAHQENTEGVSVSKQRLTYMQAFLASHDFLPKQFEFEDAKSEKPMVAQAGHLKNHRIEIRLIVP